MDWVDAAWRVSVFGIVVLFDAALKGFVILCAAMLTTLALRRTSAAMRHQVWFLAVVGLLALPALSVILPAWHILPSWAGVTPQPGLLGSETCNTSFARNPSSGGQGLSEPGPVNRVGPAVRLGQASPSMTRAGDSHVPAPGARQSTERFFATSLTIPGLFAAWAAGAACLLLSSLIGRFGLWRVSRRSTPLEDQCWVHMLRALSSRLGIRRPVGLLRGEPGTMPMTWGIWNARILLPGEADEWPSGRREAVLLHELAHLKRRDCLTQSLGTIALALHWFNPLAWLACRRMAIERERACDDLVLSTGCESADYARHLLQVVAGVRISPLTRRSAIAMARGPWLKRRLAAILDDQCNRRAVTTMMTIFSLAVSAAVVVPLASMRPAPSAVEHPLVLSGSLDGDITVDGTTVFATGDEEAMVNDMLTRLTHALPLPERPLRLDGIPEETAKAIAQVMDVQANRLLEEERFVELAQLDGWLTQIDPANVKAWDRRAWNLAYNISGLIEDPEEQWHWIRKAIAVLRDDALQANPQAAALYWELALYDRVREQYLTTMETEQTGAPKESLTTSYQNFLYDSLRLHVLHNQIDTARRIFQEIQASHPDARTERGFEAFVADQFVEGSPSPSEANVDGRVGGLLHGAYYWYALGDEDRYAGATYAAHCLFEAIATESDKPEYAGRAALPSYAALVQKAFDSVFDEFRDPSYRARLDRIRPTAGGIDKLAADTPPGVSFQVRLAEYTATPGLERTVNEVTGRPVWLHEAIELSGADVLCAQAGSDQEGAYVRLQWTNNGKRKMAALTRDNVGRLLAVLVDGRVISAPEIMMEIQSIVFGLRGSLNADEAHRLAAGLRKMPWIDVPGKPRSDYGPEVERVVRDVQGFEECWIDFDTGEVVGFDPTVNGDRLLAWNRENGLDAQYFAGGETLVGTDMIAYPVTNAFWASRWDADLSGGIRKFSDPGTPCNMSARGDLPSTYFIVTREGGEGLLQIVERMDDPKRLRVRYKLVEPVTATITPGWSVFKDVLLHAGTVEEQRLTDVVIYEVGDDGVKRVVRAQEGEFVVAGSDRDSIVVTLSQVRVDQGGTYSAVDSMTLILKPQPEFDLVAF